MSHDQLHRTPDWLSSGGLGIAHSPVRLEEDPKRSTTHGVIANPIAIEFIFDLIKPLVE
jgi:hypothetical protein